MSSVEQRVALIPTIATTILSCMTAKELNMYSCVCKLWSEVVRSIKKQRTRIHWYFFYCYVRGWNFMVDQPYEIVGTETNCFRSLKEHLNSISSEPQFVFLFCSVALVSLASTFCPTRRKRKYHSDDSDSESETDYYDSSSSEESVEYSYFERKCEFTPAVMEKFLSFYPESCDVGFFIGSNIRATSSDNSMSRETEACPALGAIYFPQAPGVGIHRFKLSTKIRKRFDIHRHTGIPANTQLKCLLAFFDGESKSTSKYSHNRILLKCLAMQEWQMAVGVTVGRKPIFPKDSKSDIGYGIAFTGENVAAASVCMPPICSVSYNDAVRILSVFREGDLLKGQCIAFMFSFSIPRFDSSRKDYDPEGDFFRTLYPDVPLFGLFGGITFGLNYPLGTKRPRRNKIDLTCETIIFVVISVRS